MTPVPSSVSPVCPITCCAFLHAVPCYAMVFSPMPVPPSLSLGSEQSATARCGACMHNAMAGHWAWFHSWVGGWHGWWWFCSAFCGDRQIIHQPCLSLCLSPLSLSPHRDLKRPRERTTWLSLISSHLTPAHISPPSHPLLLSPLPLTSLRSIENFRNSLTFLEPDSGGDRHA